MSMYPFHSVGLPEVLSQDVQSSPMEEGTGPTAAALQGTLPDPFPYHLNLCTYTFPHILSPSHPLSLPPPVPPPGGDQDHLLCPRAAGSSSRQVRDLAEGDQERHTLPAAVGTAGGGTPTHPHIHTPSQPHTQQYTHTNSSPSRAQNMTQDSVANTPFYSL